jgi:NTP pyrophosphatase (non-canonical NTP hydrolase)
MSLAQSSQPPRLDDLYKMVSSIYNDQNIGRSPSATFGHFVEVCGMLTMHDRRKRRESGLTVTDALCKAMGWYFPLLTRMRVRSLEDLVYRKYPYACPYCGLAPHRDSQCKLVRGSGTFDHIRLRQLYRDNSGRRPLGLDDWQLMFQEIYPREADDRGRSTIGLFEELGELAEAIRVFDKHPMYFLGEAADVFSYLMGIANEHSLRLAQDQGDQFSFESEFLKRYPGLCMQCGSRICVCPAIPQATVGRMAKELAIAQGESPFLDDPEIFARDGQEVGHRVLERVGGYQGLASSGLPFDRGDTNHALVILCLKVAEAVEKDRAPFAERLRAEALKLGTDQAPAGTATRAIDMASLFRDLSETWKLLDTPAKTMIKSGDDLVGGLGEILDKIRVLFLTCSPADEERLRVDMELRAAAEVASNFDRIVIKALTATTIDDFRRALLGADFDIIHFAGHADENYLVFETPDGMSNPVPLSAISELIARYPSIRCVVLNACESVTTLTTPISKITVGMDKSIKDNAALEFSRGFYDAIGAGRPIKFAIEEGISAVKLKELDATPIKVLMES